MPGFRPAKTAKVAVAKKAQGVSAVKAKSSKPGCGSGKGGFKPGNTCGKGKREALADQLKAARAKANAGNGDHATIREHARILRHHRRGKPGSIENEQAASIREHIRSGKPVGESKTKKFDPIRAEVKYDPMSGIGESHVISAASKMFGKPVSVSEIVGAIGAPHGSRVTISRAEPTSIVATFTGRSEDGKGTYSAGREFSVNHDGKLVMNNIGIAISPAIQNQGIGSRIFGQQVERAKSLGVAEIHIHAARDEFEKQFGYKVWPKLGYDAPIPPEVRSKISPKLSGAKKISELMETPEGREQWSKHGIGVDMKFDMTPGSRSLAVWQEYRKNKK